MECKRIRLDSSADVTVDWLKLPVEIYLDIFEYLTYEHLKESMVVCEKWYNIILPNFIKRTVLVLECCNITEGLPPRDVLMRSSRPFPHIQLGEELHVFDVEQDTVFWSHISKETETVSVSVFLNKKKDSEEKNTILTHFHKLNHLIGHELDDLFDFQLPDTIKSIHLEYMARWVDSCTVDQLKGLTNLKKLTADCINLTIYKTKIVAKEPELLSQLTCLYEVPKELAKEGNIEIQPINLLKTNVLEYRDIVDFTRDIFNISDLPNKQFEMFPNLTKMTLEVNEGTMCFFIHQTLDLKNVIEVRLNFDNFQPSRELPEVCLKCLNCLIESCPAIHSWEFLGISLNYETLINATPKPIRKLSIFTEHYIKIDYNFPDLEELSVFSHEESGVIDAAGWGYMPKLKKINILDFILVNIENLFSNCPAVVDLSLFVVDIATMQRIENNWPYLKELYYNAEANHLQAKRAVQGNFKSLRRYCKKYLSDVSPPYVFQGNIFGKIPTLRHSFGISYGNFVKHERDDNYRQDPAEEEVDSNHFWPFLVWFLDLDSDD